MQLLDGKKEDESISDSMLEVTLADAKAAI